MTSVAEMDAAMLRKVFDINVVGVHNYLRPVAAHMIETGRQGKIVVTLSIDALHPSAPGLGAYDASKHAAYGYMKVAALEYAKHGILINGLAPGGILTPGVTGGADTTELVAHVTLPVGRWGDADDMARVALFLGSDLNSYATGSVFVADGGRLLQ
ncbi:SDR family oxidoreductase [Cellulomonas sp. WB94]|uniref:SDR family NAD(P)-dependent oxidoreductase n=1 Tax=Cellulomonas sp. WB94 TaxID=2173174 RepID=UPI0018D4F64E|nr:SDR family oxidoreductase [Cellulomonas sp. WB94]